MDSFGNKNKKWHGSRNFFRPTLQKIIVVVILGGLVLIPFGGGLSVPSSFVLYPLTALYYFVFQPLIYSLIIDNPAYQGINYFEIFFNWIVPSIAIPFFYVIACTVVWLYEHFQKKGPLFASSIATIFLAGLFVVPIFVIPILAQAYAPQPPKDIQLVVDNQNTCESIPNVVHENKGNRTFSIHWEESNNTCVFAGTLEIPYSYTTITITEPATFVITGENSTIKAEVHNLGTIIIDDNSNFISYGMSNDGKIHIKKTGILDLRGMISSPSRSAPGGGEILPALPDRIQIINEGQLHLREMQSEVNQFSNGYIENFGSIINIGGTVLNYGEIASYENSTIVNSNGGKIEIGSYASINIYNMTNENDGSIIENFGKVYNSGTIRNIDGAIINNIGFGIVTNQGTVINDASILNRDIGQIINNWKIYSGCHGIIEGKIEGNIPLDSCNGQKI